VRCGAKNAQNAKIAQAFMQKLHFGYSVRSAAVIHCGRRAWGTGYVEWLTVKTESTIISGFTREYPAKKDKKRRPSRGGSEGLRGEEGWEG
jgi:hypothetical protein